MGAPRPKAHSALTDESISVEPVNHASARWLLDAWGRGLVVPAYSSPFRWGGDLGKESAATPIREGAYIDVTPQGNVAYSSSTKNRWGQISDGTKQL